jgi:O-antigen/teichoic acid export membrane protein
MARWPTVGKLTGAGWAVADQCVVSIANFLTIYLFARHLDAAVFGAFVLAYTGLVLLTNLQSALLTQPHNVLAAGLPHPEFRRFTGELLLAQLVTCGAVGATLAALGAVIHGHAPATGSVVLALALAAIPWLGREFVRRVLYTRGESRGAALNDGVSYGVQFIGALALVRLWGDRASAEAALLVMGGGALAGVLAGLWPMRRHVRLPGRSGLASLARTWREVWCFGRWLTAQNALAWMGGQGHSWVVALVLGAEQVGIYRAATHLVNVMNPLLQTAYSYLPSRGSLAYTGGGRDALARWVRTVWWALLLAPLPFCVVLIGFPGEVLALAYGGKYAGTELALILALATLAQCIVFAKFPFDIGLLALHATKSIFYVYLLPVVLLLTSGAALIYFLGILGVPLSNLLINSVLLVATWRAYRKQLRRGAAAPAGTAVEP